MCSVATAYFHIFLTFDISTLIKKRKEDKTVCRLLSLGPCAAVNNRRGVSIRMGLLLERLSQIEALLHVVVVGSGSVDVPNAAVASPHFTMLL